MQNRFHISTPLAVSLVAIALAAIVLAVNLFGLLTTAVSPGATLEEPDERMQTYLAMSEEELEQYRQRFDGRAIFYPPPIRPKPKPERVVVQSDPDPDPDPDPVKPPDPDPGPPPAPPTYGGPGIQYVAGRTVYFASNEGNELVFPIRVGEEKKGIKVIDVDGPRNVSVQWTKAGHEPGEYQVPVFDSSVIEGGAFSREFASDRPAAPESAVIPGYTPAEVDDGEEADDDARSRASERSGEAT